MPFVTVTQRTPDEARRNLELMLFVPRFLDELHDSKAKGFDVIEFQLVTRYAYLAVPFATLEKWYQ